MSQQEETIDLKSVLVSILKFLIQRKKIILFSFFVFVILGIIIRTLKPKNQKDLYEINYLFESSVLPKESMLSILESISKNKDQYVNESFKNVKKIDVKISYSLVELSIQSNTISSIESCEKLIEKQLQENRFIQEKIFKSNQLLTKVKLSIEEIEQLKLSKEESMSSVIEKLFYQNQSKTLVDLYKEKQKIELSISKSSGIKLVSKSTPILIQTFSILKECLLIFTYGIVGTTFIIFLSLINLIIRKMKQLNFK
jgi:hypothetical protein